MTPVDLSAGFVTILLYSTFALEQIQSHLVPNVPLPFAYARK